MYQKRCVHDKWAILGPKMAHPHNSGSTLRIFLKFYGMKDANRYMRVLFVVFWEKNSDDFKKPLDDFLLVDLAWLILARPLLVGSLNSQDMISFMIATGSLNSQDMIFFMIATGSLNSQDMIRILKQWRHDFSGKHLCDGYCMDIMWCLCVKVKIQGFVKLL